MPDDLRESAAVIAKIQRHFAVMGWDPILPIKINCLLSLNLKDLQSAHRAIVMSSDRMSAATLILELIRAQIPRPPNLPDAPDSESFQLRPDQPK